MVQVHWDCNRISRNCVTFIFQAYKHQQHSFFFHFYPFKIVTFPYCCFRFLFPSLSIQSYYHKFIFCPLFSNYIIYLLVSWDATGNHRSMSSLFLVFCKYKRSRQTTRTRRECDYSFVAGTTILTRFFYWIFYRGRASKVKPYT